MTIFLYKTVRTKNPAIDADAPKWILGFIILSLVPNAAVAQTQAGSRSQQPNRRGGNGDLDGHCLSLSWAGPKEGRARPEPPRGRPQRRQERRGAGSGFAG